MENRFKKGLGRGLSSLLGENSDKKVATNKILIKDLKRNKFQPRKNFNKENLEDLTNSIREQGVIQPILVRPDKNDDGKYEIIAGERTSREDSLLERLSAKVFYKLLAKLCFPNFPSGGFDYFLISKKVRDIIIKTQQ